MKTKKRILLFVLLLGTAMSYAQDLLTKLDSIEQGQDLPTLATFKATRISIGHSVETRKKGVLQISSMNRFWNDTVRSSQSFAADKWNARLGLEYGISDRITVGAAYGSGYQSIDAFFKYRWLRQQDTGKKFPFSLTVLQGAVYRNKATEILLGDLAFEDRLGFTTQLLIARKFSPNFSLQLSPTFVHKAEDGLLSGESASRLALGIGGRYKVGPHVSVVSEYYYVPDPITVVETYGAFALGVNWEVSDVMLQFKLTNARNFVEDKFITKTVNNFNFRDGNLHFGFHFTYVIHTQKR